MKVFKKSTARPAVAAALLLVLLAVPALAAEGVVNINTADSDTLTLLPRVGPTVAARIIEYREANGPFRSVDDLLLVKGIGERTFERLRPYVAVDGKTTLSEKVPSKSTQQ